MRTHTYESGVGNLCVMITPFEVGDVYSRIDTVTYNDGRYDLCNYKTLNLLPGVMAAQYAKEKNCDEAIFVRNGIVTEGSHCNVSIIKDKKLITHPEGKRILSGVSRRKLLFFAEQMGLEICEREYRVNELMNADEAIITSSGKIVRAIRSVDGMEIGGKNSELLTSIIDSMYKDYVEKTSAEQK